MLIYNCLKLHELISWHYFCYETRSGGGHNEKTYESSESSKELQK